MTPPKVLYAKPSITELEMRYVMDAVSNGWGEHCYDYLNRFEGEFQRYIGAEYGMATSSCTGALHLLLKALGIGAGDEVIIPEITWIASVSPIEYCNATPVFVDVLADSWCIDPKSFERAITPRTRAVIVVHLYGNMADVDAVMAIAERHGVQVIEDAAEGIGSESHGRRAGSIGEAAVFSFHGTKTLTTGEGGFLILKDRQTYERAKILAEHGRDPKIGRQFWCSAVGYKYKMSNLQASLGCAQLERADELVERKREIFHKYWDALSKWSQLAMNPEPLGTRSGYWMPTVVFDKDLGIDRDRLVARFKSANIDARVFFYPNSMFPMFTRMPENVVSYDIYSRAMNLPSYHDMSDSDIARVVDVIDQELEEAISKRR
jgi:perosamine synthetase